MKNLTITFLTLGSLFATPVAAKSGKGHEHHHVDAVEVPPHGGTLRDAKPFKAEAVISGDTIKIYIYDEKMKPIKLEKDTMDGEVEMPKKKPFAIKFKKAGDYYEGKASGISKAHRYDLVVEIKANGKTVIADFGVDNIDK